jgi:hypothetical protein
LPAAMMRIPSRMNAPAGARLRSGGKKSPQPV